MIKIKNLLPVIATLLMVMLSSSIVIAQRGGRGGGGGFGRGSGFSGGGGFSGANARGFSNRGHVRADMNVGVRPNSVGFRSPMSVGVGVGGRGFHLGIAGGRMYRSVPRSFMRLSFRGYPYYFSNGLFYGYYGGYYGSIFPPFGISIGSLPYGYWGFNFGGFPYYYHSGIYYRQRENEYEVVQAPVGASVPRIPKEAKVVVVNNEKYFEYNGTYYKEYVKEDGTIWYLIAGLNGVLNTNESNQQEAIQNNGVQNAGNSASASTSIVPAVQLNIGDIVEALPVDCKAVIVNNRKYFVSSNNIFFEEFIENNTLKYKVVGK
jgi:hypothetical protein